MTANKKLIADALDRIDWYRRCLEDVQDGLVVRGLAEAKAGFDSAMSELIALAAEVARLEKENAELHSAVADFTDGA